MADKLQGLEEDNEVLKKSNIVEKERVKDRERSQ